MRKVVTGLDGNGRSVVIYDGPPQTIHHITSAHVGSLTVAHVSEFADPVPAGEAYAAEIWETDGPPIPNAPDRLATPQRFMIEPPGNGLRVRYSAWGPNLDSTTMHSTDTLDINFVLSGEVELLLEEGRSVMLQTGDSVVIPGIPHGWKAGPNGVKLLMFMKTMEQS